MKRSLHFRLSLLLLALVLLLGCVGIAAGATDGNFDNNGDGTFVEYAGRVNTKGKPINYANGVRPAITFDLANYCGTND